MDEKVGPRVYFDATGTIVGGLYCSRHPIFMLCDEFGWNYNLSPRGYLSWKSWKRQHCALMSGYIGCEDEPHGTFDGVVPLRGAKLEVAFDKRDFCFAVRTPNRTYNFAADDEIQLSEWSTAIAEAIALLTGLKVGV